VYFQTLDDLGVFPACTVCFATVPGVFVATVPRRFQQENRQPHGDPYIK
jgi:hypothetical protein